MARAILTTGGNMGDRLRNLDAARCMIAERAGEIVAMSSVRESEPWGEMEENAASFLNQLVIVETPLAPEQLLDALQEIERDLGRIRNISGGNKNGEGVRKYLSRTMDIDIIFYGDACIRSPRLTIPHPLAEQREFVLALAAEVMPDYVHPANGTTVAELLEKLKIKEK